MSVDSQTLSELHQKLISAYTSARTEDLVMWMEYAYLENSTHKDGLRRETGLSPLIAEMVSLPGVSQRHVIMAFEAALITAINTDKVHQGIHLDCAMDYLKNAGSGRLSSLIDLHKTQEKSARSVPLNGDGSRRVMRRLVVGYMLTGNMVRAKGHVIKIIQALSGRNSLNSSPESIAYLELIKELAPEKFNKLKEQYKVDLARSQFQPDEDGLFKPRVIEAIIPEDERVCILSGAYQEAIGNHLHFKSLDGGEKIIAASDFKSALQKYEFIRVSVSNEHMKELVVDRIKSIILHDDMYEYDTEERQKTLSLIPLIFNDTLSILKDAQIHMPGFISDISSVFHDREVIGTDPVDNAASFMRTDFSGFPMKTLLATTILGMLPKQELVERFGNDEVIMSHMQRVTKDPALIEFVSKERKREFLGESFGL